MPFLRLRMAMLMALFFSPTAFSAPAPVRPKLDPSVLLPALTNNSTDALAGTIRGCLVRSMPVPLYEDNPGWGQTRPVWRGTKWKGKGLDIHAEPIYVPKKDGRWRHIVVNALNPADTLVFDVRDLQQVEPGRLTFTIFLSFDARLEYEQQDWDAGRRVYSSSARARFRVRTNLTCEATFRLESGSLLLPEAVLRLRVVRSQLGYDNFVTEHAAGVGGEAAKVLGDAIKGGLNHWHPGLERDLLAQANARIESAADTKEVRISLQDVIKKRGWLGGQQGTPAPAR